MEELFRLWTCLDFFIPFCSCYRDCHCGSYTRGSPPTDLLIAIISTNSHFVLLRLYGYTITHQFVVLVLHLATVFIVRVAILDIWVVKPHVHLSVHGNLNTSWALLWLPLAYSLMPRLHSGECENAVCECDYFSWPHPMRLLQPNDIPSVSLRVRIMAATIY